MPNSREWHVVLARFVVEVEKQTRGTQTVLHSLFLVKAVDEKDAVRRLRPQFDHLARPSPNARGELTRCRLDRVVQVDLAGFDAPNPDGVEIFTGLMKDRKMNPESAWTP